MKKYKKAISKFLTKWIIVISSQIYAIRKKSTYFYEFNKL